MTYINIFYFNVVFFYESRVLLNVYDMYEFFLTFSLPRSHLKLSILTAIKSLWC